MTIGSSAGETRAWVKSGIGFTATLALVAAALFVHGATLGSPPDGDRSGTSLRTRQEWLELKRRLQPHERLHAGMTQDEVRSVLGEPDVDYGANVRGETKWSYTLGSRRRADAEEEAVPSRVQTETTTYMHPRFVVLRFRDGTLIRKEVLQP